MHTGSAAFIEITTFLTSLIYKFPEKMNSVLICLLKPSNFSSLCLPLNINLIHRL